jgi:lysyl endopeptidase
MTTNRINFVCILICMCATMLNAQHFEQNLPISFEQNLPNPTILDVPDLDWEKIKTEDARAAFDVRFAAPQILNISTQNNGTWSETADGFRVWRSHFRVPTAKGLSLMLSQINVPKNATLFAFDPEKKNMIGPYSGAQLMAQKGFMTGILSGKELILEYSEPISAQKGSFELKRIDIAYRDEQSFMSQTELESRGFGDALSCHINANCPDGNDWNNEKRGVCRIMMVLEEGTGWCTGTLMNNARQDGKPYILTAFHCQDTYTPIYELWRFDFGFEATNCTSPTSIPAFKSMIGCNYRAGRQALDFLLLELDDVLPKSFNAYFNGWDRQNTVPTATVSLHHPKGDIKKITYDPGSSTQIFNQPIQWNTNFMTPAGNHFINYPTNGTLQTGSSGCGLFNTNHRLVATLGGGNFNGCTVDNAFYPRFSLMWNQGTTSASRLREWLDPDSTNVSTVNGANQSALSNTLTGKIQTVNGVGINLTGVTLQTATVALDSVTTDTSGIYTFNIPRYVNGVYVVPTKYINVKNGISTIDLVLIRKHILNLEPLPSVFHRLACDVNASGTISTADIVQVQKINLNSIQKFAVNVPFSWMYYIKNFNPLIPQTLSPFYAPIAIEPTKSLYRTDFIGVKLGDANQSADPTK